MKKIKLPINNRVTFNEEEHTYTLSDGTQLSGITNIIHKYLFPCMYDNVSETVMQAARERGKRIHAGLQLAACGASFVRETPDVLEVKACWDVIKRSHLKPIAAEYLVSDNMYIATCIDAVMQEGDDIVLIDYKTTSKLYTEYLQWQLSIEALLFETQTEMHVKKLYAVHIPKDGDIKLVEIERLPEDYVMGLITAHANNELLFDNPLHKLSEDTNELLDQYLQAELSLTELKASVKYYEDIQSDIKNKLREQMDAQATTKLESDKATITRKADSVRKTFKPELMRDIAPANVNKWLDKNLDKCYAETKVNGSITIKFK